MKDNTVYIVDWEGGPKIRFENAADFGHDILAGPFTAQDILDIMTKNDQLTIEVEGLRAWKRGVNLILSSRGRVS